VQDIFRNSRYWVSTLKPWFLGLPSSFDNRVKKIYLSGCLIEQLRNMGKKGTILATACIIIVVVVFFELYVFKTPMQETTTVSIIMSDPSAWVSRTVIVEGNLYSFPFPVIVQSPYNYELSSDGQMIGVSLSASVNMSMSLWNQVWSNSASVKIHGVIEKGEIIDTAHGSTTTYYIEALTLTKSPGKIRFSKGRHNPQLRICERNIGQSIPIQHNHGRMERTKNTNKNSLTSQLLVLRKVIAEPNRLGLIPIV